MLMIFKKVAAQNNEIYSDGTNFCAGEVNAEYYPQN